MLCDLCFCTSSCRETRRSSTKSFQDALRAHLRIHQASHVSGSFADVQPQTRALVCSSSATVKSLVAKEQNSATIGPCGMNAVVSSVCLIGRGARRFVCGRKRRTRTKEQFCRGSTSKRKPQKIAGRRTGTKASCTKACHRLLPCRFRCVCF